MARRGTLFGGALLVVALSGCATAAGKGPTVVAGSSTTVASSVVDLTTATTEAPSTEAGGVVGSAAAGALRPVVTDNRVFLEGDSITESVGPRYSGAVCNALEALGWNVAVDAQQGRNTSQAVQSMRSHLSSLGQVLVILIGHNDGIDPAAYHDNLTRLIGLAPHARWILLLTNYEFERGRDHMNLVLYEIANSDSRIQIVDWNDVVQGTKGAIQADGLHLTSVGEQALATTIAGALGAAPPAPPGRSATPSCITFRNRTSTGGTGSGRGAGGSGTGSGGRSRATSTTEPSSESTGPPPTDGGGSTTDAPHRTDPPTTGDGSKGSTTTSGRTPTTPPPAKPPPST